MTTMRHLNTLVAVACAATAGSLSAQPASVNRSVTYYPRSDELPFSEAVRIENRLVLSGQVGISDDNTTVVPGGWEPETRRAMTLIGAVLKKHGLGYDDITQCTVMLVDIGQWAAFNGVYGSYFQKGHYPARMTFGASGLPRGAHVEIACQARFKS